MIVMTLKVSNQFDRPNCDIVYYSEVSALRHSTGSRSAARAAGVVPNASPIAPETKRAKTAEIQENCRSKPMKRRIVNGMMKPTNVPMIPPTNDMSVDSMRN